MFKLRLLFDCESPPYPLFLACLLHTLAFYNSQRRRSGGGGGGGGSRSPNENIGGGGQHYFDNLKK